MTRPKNPASIVSKYRSRWNCGASVEATVTQEKSTRLNGHRKPNHQTFFLQIPTRSGSTSGRAVSTMSDSPRPCDIYQVPAGPVDPTCRLASTYLDGGRLTLLTQKEIIGTIQISNLICTPRKGQSHGTASDTNSSTARTPSLFRALLNLMIISPSTRCSSSWAMMCAKIAIITRVPV